MFEEGQGGRQKNEIVAVPKLMEVLDLRGRIVTLEAMGCQKKIAAAIRQQGTDNIFRRKDNHPWYGRK